jgi:hypothetical protein
MPFGTLQNIVKYKCSDAGSPGISFPSGKTRGSGCRWLGPKFHISAYLYYGGLDVLTNQAILVTNSEQSATAKERMFFLRLDGSR